MLLFDMDGTLIDSNGIWKDVDTEFLARRGLPYTQAYYEGVAHTIFPWPIRISPPAPERWRRPAKNSSAGSTRRKWRRFKAVRVDFWQRCHYNCVVAFVRRLSCAAAAGRSR